MSWPRVVRITVGGLGLARPPGLLLGGTDDDIGFSRYVVGEDRFFWSAAAFLEIEKSFRKIMGFRDLWALKAILDGSQPAIRQAVA